MAKKRVRSKVKKEEAASPATPSHNRRTKKRNASPSAILHKNFLNLFDAANIINAREHSLWSLCGDINVALRANNQVNDIGLCSVYHKGQRISLNVPQTSIISYHMSLDKFKVIPKEHMKILYFEPITEHTGAKLDYLYSLIEKENSVAVVDFNGDRILAFIPSRPEILKYYGLCEQVDAKKHIAAIVHLTDEEIPLDATSDVYYANDPAVKKTQPKVALMQLLGRLELSHQQIRDILKVVGQPLNAVPPLNLNGTVPAASGANVAPPPPPPLGAPGATPPPAAPLQNIAPPPPQRHGASNGLPTTANVAPPPPSQRAPPPPSAMSTGAAPPLPPPPGPPHYSTRQLSPSPQPPPHPHYSNAPPPPPQRAPPHPSEMRGPPPPSRASPPPYGAPPPPQQWNKPPPHQDSWGGPPPPGPPPPPPPGPPHQDSWGGPRQMSPPSSYLPMPPPHPQQHPHLIDDMGRKRKREPHDNMDDMAPFMKRRHYTLENLESPRHTNGVDDRHNRHEPRGYNNGSHRGISPPPPPQSKNAQKKANKKEKKDKEHKDSYNPTQHLWVGFSSGGIDFSSVRKDFSVDFPTFESIDFLKHQKCAFVHYGAIEDAIAAKRKWDGTAKYPRISYKEGGKSKRGRGGDKG